MPKLLEPNRQIEVGSVHSLSPFTRMRHRSGEIMTFALPFINQHTSVQWPTCKVRPLKQDRRKEKIVVHLVFQTQYLCWVPLEGTGHILLKAAAECTIYLFQSTYFYCIMVPVEIFSEALFYINNILSMLDLSWVDILIVGTK